MGQLSFGPVKGTENYKKVQKYRKCDLYFFDEDHS